MEIGGQGERAEAFEDQANSLLREAETREQLHRTTGRAAAAEKAGDVEALLKKANE
jgi:hypothetical protein